MDNFERFLEKLHQMPLKERVIIFRAEALRPLHMALGIAGLLQNEIESNPELSDEVDQWSHKLLHHLDEMRQLLDALVDQDEED